MYANLVRFNKTKQNAEINYIRYKEQQIKLITINLNKTQDFVCMIYIAYIDKFQVAIFQLTS